MQRAGSRPSPGGSPAGDGPHPVLTDTLLPPQEPGTVIKEHCTSQPLGDAKGGKAQEEQGLCYFKASRVQAAPGKAKTSSRYSRLSSESDVTESLVLIPSRPPLFHTIWWLGTPSPWGKVCWPDARPCSYLLRRAACCPCCGGTP